MKKRSYKQNCALARAMDLVGERWTLLIVRELFLGPRRYGELLANLPGMGTNLLATRLQELEHHGLIANGTLDDVARAGKNATYYQLTAAGAGLEPVILSLLRWMLVTFERTEEPGDYHHASWDLLALQSLFNATAAPETAVVVQFDCDGWQGWARVGPDGYESSEGVYQQIGSEKGSEIATGIAPDSVWQAPIGTLALPAEQLSTTDAWQALSDSQRDGLQRFIKAFEPLAGPAK